MRRTVSLLLALLAALTASAQRLDIATDAAALAELFTLNTEARLSPSDSSRFRFTASAEYNPWTFFNADGGRFQHRKRSFAAGVRRRTGRESLGLYAGAEIQYMQYNCGGVISKTTYEGDAVGAGLYLAWIFAERRRFSFEISAGLWGGFEHRTVYACPRCGRVLESGDRFFVRPDNVSISIIYTFNLTNSTNNKH